MKSKLNILTLVLTILLLGFLSLSILPDSGNFNLALINANSPENVLNQNFLLSSTVLDSVSANGVLLVAITPDGVIVLAKKNVGEKFYIASITKLMTAVVASENLNLILPIEISNNDLKPNSLSGFLKKGDVLSGKEILSSMLIESNNDAAWALSHTIEQDKFVDLMNSKAAELGMNRTTFNNPAGLDARTKMEPGNQSTVGDLLRLAKYILVNHPDIFAITTRHTKNIEFLDGSLHHVATNTNELFWNIDFPYTIAGSKTGQTPFANTNLLLLYKALNFPEVTFVSIVLDSKNQFEDTLILAKALRINSY